eukprot:Nitzschia sp. Nitz4//scaffold46_size129759//117223//121400//NITZ4_003525-RA/size129759-augustus-gene-0.28-mRNA-1//-1//CDS//3329552667//9452//frame0
MSDEQADEQATDGDRLDYLKREYFLPAQRARPDASLEDDDSHDLFMSEPSISEADESEFASNMRLLSPLESFEDDEDEDNQLAPPLPPPPLPPTPSRNTPQAPSSPGNTSLSSWESSQVSRRGVHLHFSPDHRSTASSPFQRKEFPSNQQPKQTASAGPPVDGGNVTPTDFLAAALIPPSSGAKTPDRSFVHSSNSTSPASEGHRKVFEAFLDGLRLESQGKVQNTTDTNLSFESSSYFDYGRGMDLQGVLRPQQDTSASQFDKQHQEHASGPGDVQDHSVDTHSTDPSHPGTPGIKGDETIAMVLSDDSVEDFSKLSGVGDDGSMSSNTNQPLVWEEKSSSSEEKAPPPPPQSKPQPQPQSQSQHPLASNNPFQKPGSMSPPENTPPPLPPDSKPNPRVNAYSKSRDLPPRREGSSTSLNSLNVDTFQHPDATSRAEIEKFSQFAIGTADSFQDSFQFLAPPAGDHRRDINRTINHNIGLLNRHMQVHLGEKVGNLAMLWSPRSFEAFKISMKRDPGMHVFPSPIDQEGTPLVGQMYGPHFAPHLRRDSSRSSVSPNMSTRVSFGQRFDDIRERVQASPFANIGKRFTKADRKRFLPAGLNDAIDKYPTFICPVCKTRQREFFTVSTAPLQFESASGYIAFYFTVYVIAALYIFGLQEGWSKLDCIYFAVITLTTAGLGDFVPTSTGAKVVCSIFIYFGVACIGLLLGSYIAGMLDESSRRAVKENRIKSCPNCARIQNIKEAAERRRKQFRRQRKMEKNVFASSPMEGDEDTPQHNSKRVKRNPTTESLSAADVVRLAREELVVGGIEGDRKGLETLTTPRSASDLEEIPENTVNDLSPVPSTPMNRANMLSTVQNSPSTRQILRRQGHSRHISFDGRDKGPRPRRVFSADLGVPGTAVKEGTKGVTSSVRITPTQQARWRLSDSSGSDDDDDESFASTDSVDGSQMEDILEPHLDRVKNARYVFLTLREALLNSLVIIGFGCFGFYMIEGFSIVDSWYFTTVLLTTVGYGDFVPYTKGGKLFATVYILVAGTILLNNMSLISMIPLELRRRRTEKAVLTQFGDSLDDMALRELATGPLIRRLHLATDDNGELDECTREMFCLAMLVRLGKVTEEDIKLTMAAFKKLDVNNEQVLNTRAIIAGMIQKSRSTAYLNRMNQKETVLVPPNEQSQPSYGAVNPPPPHGQPAEESFEYDGYDVSYEASPPEGTQDFWISRSSERSGQHGAFFP